MDNEKKIMKLHLGCGKRYLDGWVNIDIDSEVADQKLNLTDPLPYPDQSVSYIYAEHFIEHIYYSELEKLFVECKRALIPNGVIRVTTPSLRYMINCYLNDKIDEWVDVDFAPRTICQMINEGFRRWGHKYIYDEEELSSMLIRIGFIEIEMCKWGKSKHSVFDQIESRPYHHDLIMEGKNNV